MLVLTRYPSEWIVILDANGIELCRFVVKDVNQGRASIGFVADDDITIVRAELLDQERKETE